MVEMESRTVRDKDSGFGRRALISALSGQRITYLVAGAMTAVLYYGLLGLGLLIAKDGVPYLFLVVVCYLVAATIIYPWYRLVVFRGTRESWPVGYLRFYAVGLSFLATSIIGLPILVGFAGIPILVAQGLIIIASPPLSYLIHRTWTFRTH
ncbi:Putative flippase GtrA (transmembrane translocase of bactoprenol-linked glucose) [Streptosporangium subroseum]|uniref:Putative flippase GtrA (Transmembrane translocase of bactoprenol-linked glucose) n=1 Tax=Streptosporangium subroseum TaxID=106412 RepID=A0A239CLH4_9ACTN|nr:GtrA family protein [Streptosporangium subroseum]SNS20789.1 Putative flippase GtrA (transmembrane translocase of bactoprenol-linked glucose) [Streptosporangium subroseum]